MVKLEDSVYAMSQPIEVNDQVIIVSTEWKGVIGDVESIQPWQASIIYNMIVKVTYVPHSVSYLNIGDRVNLNDSYVQRYVP